jgi:hypothetical protein
MTQYFLGKFKVNNSYYQIVIKIIDKHNVVNLLLLFYSYQILYFSTYNIFFLNTVVYINLLHYSRVSYLKLT